jgi:hypothetical protein
MTSLYREASDVVCLRPQYIAIATLVQTSFARVTLASLAVSALSYLHPPATVAFAATS